MRKKITNSYPFGTIIFQSLQESEGFSRAVSLSGAQPLSPREFININHVGLYIGNNTIIEATRQYGVINRRFSDFLSTADYSIAVTIKDSALIDQAVNRALGCLGQPYNHSFYPDDYGFYCSELITYAFQYQTGEDYFQQYPMNFVDGVSQQILPYWLDYYRQLGRDIPQGVFGSHPQQLLRQQQLFATMDAIAL